MAKQKKPIHRVQMTEGKRNIIHQLLEEYDIQSAEDIQDALKDLLGGTIKEMMEAEMDDHLGYEKSERSDNDDYRNGYKHKQVNSRYGSMEIEVPQDRKSTFSPQIVKKRQKDISDIDQKIISMYAKGMTTRQISETIEDIYGFETSESFISDVTDKILPQIEDWQNRPLDEVYPILYIDATHGIGVYVDYRNQIEESDETNNFLGKYFTWYDEDNYAPDLTVEITSPTNNTILEGTYADESNKETVEFKIANIGPVDSPDNKFTLYVYADGKPITGMRVSPMSKFTALSGNFKMNVNAYKAFELEMVIDTLNEVKEANENNNSDLKEYNVRYCIHRSNNITEPPFPADDVKVQINTNAFFGYMTQDLYASKLGAWNGITDKVKIKNVVVSSSDNISDETQVYILSDAEAFNLFPYTPAWTEQTGNSNALIVITLNDALMSTRTEEQCARTLIHELGHVFGMDHPNESEDGCEYASILYQSSYDNPTKCSSQVTGHDKYGLYNIYEDLSVQAANLEQGELCSNVLVYLDKLIQVDSEQVLSNNSDYIVKGRTLPNKQNIATDFSGYTQTNLIVDDVFKGEGLTQGEIIQIKEPYYTRVLDSGVEKTTYYDGYTPSEEGEEYIFFLNRLDNSNDYVLTFTSLSRYTANDIVVTGIFEENSVGYSEEIYKELREAVIEKYN